MIWKEIFWSDLRPFAPRACVPDLWTLDLSFRNLFALQKSCREVVQSPNQVQPIKLHRRNLGFEEGPVLKFTRMEYFVCTGRRF